MPFRKSALLYGLATGLSRALGFLMLPVYVQAVSPDEFGTFDFWTAQILFLAPIVYLQFWDGFYRLATLHPGQRSQILGTSLWIGLLGTAIYLILIGPILFLYAGTAWEYFLAFGLTVAMQNVMSFLARLDGHTLALALSGIANAATVAAVTVSFLTFTSHTEALVSGLCFGNLIQALVLATRLRIHRSIRKPVWSTDTARSIARFCIPLCATSLAYWALTGFTRLIILIFEGSAAAGHFGVAARMGAVMAAIGLVLNMAWNDSLYRASWTKEQTKSRLSSLAESMLILTGIAMLALNFVYAMVFPQSYEPARQLIPAILLFSALMAMNGLAATAFMANDNTRPLAKAATTAAFANLLIAPIATYFFGVAGACSALTLIGAAMFGYRYYRARVLYGVAPRSSHLLRPTLICCASFAVFVSEAGLLWTMLITVVAFTLLAQSLLWPSKAGRASG